MPIVDATPQMFVVLPHAMLTHQSVMAHWRGQPDLDASNSAEVSMYTGERTEKHPNQLLRIIGFSQYLGVSINRSHHRHERTSPIKSRPTERSWETP